MTDLVLSEDRKQYQDLARDFAQNEITPKAHDFDHSGQFPLDLCLKAWDIGLINGRIPEKLGGLGLGVSDAAVIAEELGAGCAGITSAVWGNDLAVAPLLVAGSETQQKQWLEPLMSQFSLAAYCFDLPNYSHLQYTVNGDQFTFTGKAACINAHNAKWIFAVAEESDKPARTTAFVIPMDADGLKIESKLPAVGIRCADLSVVQCDNVKVNAANVIGEQGQATALAKGVAAFIAPILASYAVGVARTALENSVRYSKERHTMGKPIANHQAVGFMLADMAKDIEAARLLSQKAAWVADAGEPDEAASLMAQCFAVDMAMKAATDAVQVYGGYGYSREYPVEKLMRDAKMLQVYIGNSDQIQLNLGRQLVSSIK